MTSRSRTSSIRRTSATSAAILSAIATSVLRRRHQGEPGAGAVAGKALLLEGRRVGQGGRAGRGADAQDPDLAGAMQRQRRAEIVEHEVDIAAGQIGQGGRAALVGDVHHLDAGHVLEQHRREMRRRARSLRSVVQAAALLLAIGDELADRSWPAGSMRIASTVGTPAITAIGVNCSGSNENDFCTKRLMTRGPAGLASSVWPSGGAFATNVLPVVPAAPGRFSTMTGWRPALGKLGADDARDRVGGAAGRETARRSSRSGAGNRRAATAIARTAPRAGRRVRTS